MVTAGTYQKAHHFRDPQRLDFVNELLFAVADEFGWGLRAWAVFSNHYHFLANSPDDPASLRPMLNKLHMLAARHVNEIDSTPQRRVWFQFWDSRITFEKSYLARLRYVNENPVKHGVASNAENYRWCSAAWFAQSAPKSFFRTVSAFKTNRVNVFDDF